MAGYPNSKYFGRFLAGVLLLGAAFASEHHGVVRSNGLAVPGATVTAKLGGKQVVTTTDAQGAYSFRDLADGNWTIQVEMLGFAPQTKEVGIAPDAPSPEWDLKLLPMAALRQSLAPKPAPAAAQPVVAAATSKPAPAVGRGSSRPDPGLGPAERRRARSQ